MVIAIAKNLNFLILFSYLEYTIMMVMLCAMFFIAVVDGGKVLEVSNNVSYMYSIGS